MDLSSVTTVISTLGFPIVACIYSAYIVKDMIEKHADEMDAIKDSLNANTSAIDKLETLINTLMNQISKMNGGE